MAKSLGPEDVTVVHPTGTMTPFDTSHGPLDDNDVWPDSWGRDKGIDDSDY